MEVAGWTEVEIFGHFRVVFDTSETDKDLISSSLVLFTHVSKAGYRLIIYQLV